ncbi:MAG: signal peptidase II [Agathobacter sp.]|nr:signal peptidase II [Agathobacter sp.]
MSTKKSMRNMGISGLITLILIFLDQITKWLAVEKLSKGEPFVLIKNVFELQYLENQSAAFGIDLVTIFQNIFKLEYFENNPAAFLRAKMIFFIVITILVTIFLCFLYRKIPSTPRFRWLNVTMVLFVSGAIGNLIDRIVNNYVVDFFYFKLINFPIFNVADIYVTVGAFLFIFLCLFVYREEDFEVIFPKKSLD